MFHFKHSEIRLPQKRGEEVRIGQIYEDRVFVSWMTLRKDTDGVHILDTKFAASAVNLGRDGEWADEATICEAVSRARDGLCRFILRHQDRFSFFPSAA